MAKFTLTIDCDNAAFDNPGLELARIMRIAARQVESFLHDRDARDDSPLRDVNGNTVGKWTYGKGRR